VGGRPVALADRGRRALDALVAQGTPGRTTVAFRRAWEDTGEPFPGVPLVTGVGLGMEPPVVGFGGPGPAGEGQVAIEPGMVLAVQACVADPAAGTWFARETIVVTDGGPEVLTTLALA
jgi:Xaa-Pro dipeptidase